MLLAILPYSYTINFFPRETRFSRHKFLTFFILKLKFISYLFMVLFDLIVWLSMMIAQQIAFQLWWWLFCYIMYESSWKIATLFAMELRQSEIRYSILSGELNSSGDSLSERLGFCRNCFILLITPLLAAFSFIPLI